MNFLQRLQRKIRMIFRLPLKYKINGVKLWLPPEHLLPFYQAKFPLYDRFLPFLAYELPAKSIVIDVGANVGDTSVPLFDANPSLIFMCIEPDDYYFKFLCKNTANKGGSFVLRKSLIGTKSESFTLKGGGGTKTAKSNVEGSMRHESLDSLVKVSNSDEISLIKTDTDGWDHDVILSGQITIKRFKPLIFSEFQLVNSSSIHNYIKAIRMLREVGYDQAFIFRNVGQYHGSKNLLELESFLSQQAGDSLRYKEAEYFDILLSDRNHLLIAENAVKRFINHFSIT
jgi:FkbM family methyltransferase